MTVKIAEIITWSQSCAIVKAVDGLTLDKLADMTYEIERCARESEQQARPTK